MGWGLISKTVLRFSKLNSLNLADTFVCVSKTSGCRPCYLLMSHVDVNTKHWQSFRDGFLSFSLLLRKHLGL